MWRAFSICCSTLLLVACSGVRMKWGAYEAKSGYVVNNPYAFSGDPERGRRVFIEQGCIDCHRVAEDRNLPRGRAAAAGPLLERMDRYTPSELAETIRAPRTGKEMELAGKTHVDYAQPLTARQLADVVAYLREPPREMTAP